jgi:hypothetical protein
MAASNVGESASMKESEEARIYFLQNLAFCSNIYSVGINRCVSRFSAQGATLLDHYCTSKSCLE